MLMTFEFIFLHLKVTTLLEVVSDGESFGSKDGSCMGYFGPSKDFNYVMWICHVAPE